MKRLSLVATFSLIALLTGCKTDSNNSEIDPNNGNTPLTWYEDADGDSFGNPFVSKEASLQPLSYVGDNTDCDDTRAEVNPSLLEVCIDGLDNNCDGIMDFCGISEIYEAKLYGKESGSSGSSISMAPDINGDGLDDIIIGAPYEEIGGFPEGGSIYIVYGSVSGDIELTEADAKLIGVHEGERAGTEVEGVGDINGDGFGDVAISAPGNETNGSGSGAVYLFFGPVEGESFLSEADAWFYGNEFQKGLSLNISSAINLNDDSYNDLVFSASSEIIAHGEGINGAVYFFHGPVSGEVNLDSANARILGEFGGDMLGNSVVENAGDVNGDGLEDILIGRDSDLIISNSEFEREIYLILSPVSGIQSIVDVTDALFRSEEEPPVTGSGIGDINGDGYDDILIGTPGEWTGSENCGGYAGATYLFLGPVSGEVDFDKAYAKFVGETTCTFDDSISLSGASAYIVGKAGDFDGSGIPDIIIGAPGASDCDLEIRPGATYIIFDPSPGTHNLSSADVKMMGMGYYDDFGGVIDGFGDVNGDGLDDIIVNSKNNYINENSYFLFGATYLVLGREL